jgi:hypothetical protein
MSLSTGSALKAYLETHNSEWMPVGVGLPWYRDKAPEGAVLPYGVVQEGLAKPSVQRGDNGRNGVVAELAQATVYQNWRNADSTMAEIPNLSDKIAECLDGARLITGPTVVYGCSIFNALRTLDNDNNLIANIITVTVTRKRT